MLLTWFMVLGIGAVRAKGNHLCNGKGTQLPTTATLACDGTMNAYVDGRKIEGEKIDRITAEEYAIPGGSSVLAIHCEQETLVARILGMIGNKTMLSGSNEWLCTNQYYEQWNTSDFVDSSWTPGVSFGKNLKTTIPYGRVVNISSEAEWIGTGENSTENNTLYCRVQLCQATKSCTYFSATRIDDYRLIDNTFSTIHARNVAECAFKCAGLISRCLSFNYITNTTSRERAVATCELNNSTQIMKPESFLPKSGVIYYFKTTHP